MPGRKPKAVAIARQTEPMLQAAGAGFLFWAVFLLALDPDLIFGAAAGWFAAAEQDAVRIFAASVVGACMAAVQYVLVSSIPVTAERLAFRLAVHATVCLVLSACAIAVAHAGAPFVLAADNPRLEATLADDLAGNTLLLSFALAVFSALLHVLLRREAATPVAATAFADRIPVQTRSGTLLVDATSVDWVEAQGNYAALHIGAETHLVRETLTRLSERLDPADFVRIHRSTIVNVSRLERVQPLTSGDALVELADGRELRASRTFAGRLRERVRG